MPDDELKRSEQIDLGIIFIEGKPYKLQLLLELRRVPGFNPLRPYGPVLTFTLISEDGEEVLNPREMIDPSAEKAELGFDKLHAIFKALAEERTTPKEEESRDCQVCCPVIDETEKPVEESSGEKPKTGSE